MLGDLELNDRFRLLEGTKVYVFLDYKPPYAKVRNTLGQTVYILVKGSTPIVMVID